MARAKPLAAPPGPTPEVSAKIISALRAGTPLSTAAAFAGVDESIVRGWVEQGRAAKKGPLHDFARAASKVQAEVAVGAAAVLRKEATAGNWRAAASLRKGAREATLKCRECGTAFVWVPGPEGGRPPKFCEDHRSPQAKKQRRRVGGAPDPDDASAARKLAIALGLEKDPARAAKMVGLRVTELELAALVQAASSEAYRGLREGRMTDASAMCGTIMMLGLQLLLEQMHEIPPTSLPAALRSVAETQKHLGGWKMTRTNVRLAFVAPKAAT